MRHVKLYNTLPRGVIPYSTSKNFERAAAVW